jgi:hypothetical protein
MIKSIGKDIAARLSPTRAHWSGLRADFTQRLRHFRRGRDAGLQEALTRDFALVLEAWGIEDENDIPGIVSDLRLRCLWLAFPILLALVSALLTPGLYSGLTLLLVAPPCLFGILATGWRISLLQHRAFMPLLRWLAAPFIRAISSLKLPWRRKRGALSPAREA